MAKSDEAIIQLDSNWKLVEINKKGLEFTGYSKEELLGSDLSQIIDPNYQRNTCDFYQIQREKQITTTVFEFPIHLKNGNQRWIRQKFHILYGPNSEVTGYLGLSNDITEMIHLKKQLSVTDQVLEKRVNWRTKELEKINTKLRNEIELRSHTEEALRESEKEYRSLFQNANDAIIIIDAENEKILEVNDIACEIYRLTREEFLKKSFKDTLGSKAGLERNLIFQTLNQKKYYVGEITLSVNSEEITLDVHANEVVYKGRKAILSLNRDITSKKKIQKELLDEKTRGMTALIDGQEMERRRLSRELHDGLGQLLTTSLIYIKQLKKNIDPDSAEIADRINQILENTMEEVRSISHNLMPSVLDDFGLPLALKNMVNNLKKNNETNISLLVDENLPRLSPEVEVGFYRIAQEGLNNALKHAGTSEILIELKKKNNQIELSIRDSGDGFTIDSEYIQKGGNGIANMSQRAHSIGGQFKIKSNKGAGTVISVMFKLTHEQN
ncbi:MAG: PAS domain S-box protein [Bacteroidota bacterium]